MNIRYRVELNEGERAQLTAMLSGGGHAARKLKRAQILLAADAGISDAAIASSVSVGGSTVYRTKQRFVEGNLDLALSEEARPGAARKLSGKETVEPSSMPVVYMAWGCVPGSTQVNARSGRAREHSAVT